MRIDVHAHYYTPPFMERMWSLGCTWRPTQDILDNAGITQKRTDELDAAGVTLQVLSIGAQQPYLADVADAIEGARFANDFYAEAVSSGGGRFEAFGCLPLPHVDAAIAEIRRGYDDLGFIGVSLGCSVAGRPLDDAEFEPVWAELDRRGAVVFLHPLGIGGPMQDAYNLVWNVGAMFEDTVTALRLVRSGIVDRYPRVRIIVPHLGGTIPFLWRRVGGANEKMANGLRKLYYDSANETHGSLRCACETLGVERIMLGTDDPYYASTACVRAVQEAGLSSDDVERILGANARDLLGIEEHTQPS